MLQEFSPTACRCRFKCRPRRRTWPPTTGPGSSREDRKEEKKKRLSRKFGIRDAQMKCQQNREEREFKKRKNMKASNVSAKVPTHILEQKKFWRWRGRSWSRIFKVIQRWISNVKSAVLGRKRVRSPKSKSFSIIVAGI